MPKHALLSASSSHRWLNCPPSARLCEGYDDKGSDFAAEGTDAHALCEFKLRTALGMEARDPTEDLTWYNSEMEECANGYVAFVMELVEEAKKTCPDPVVLIEQRLDYSEYVEEGFGTGDCVIIGDGTLHIVDYKHGRGVLVEADDNPQMKLYALGALELFDCMLQNTAAEVLGLDKFDEDVFSQQIEEVIVIGDDTLTFRFYDGHEVTTKWQSTAKTDWWTDERRKLWGERHKRKDTNPNRNTFYEFTGFMKCGCCGANYRCQSGKRKDGTPTRSWYCTGPRSECRNPAIRDETMKRLVTEILGLDEFDEAAMDAQIESATILDHMVTFHFRDGHIESRDFLDKRHGTPWTEERREKEKKSMKAAWTDERREAMSERITKIRSEKKWPNP